MTEGNTVEGGGVMQQEAMPAHFCQSLMETAIINEYVNIHREAAGYSALRHRNLD